LRRTSRLVLLAGVFLAAITFIVIVLLFTNQCQGSSCPTPGQSLAPTTRDVVVAAVDIPLGTVIDQTMVTVQKDVALSGINAGALQATSQAIGQKVYQSVTAGEQITSTMVTLNGGVNQHPDPGKGLRAFAITVNELTGVGNLVTVGDYVDVLISENVTVVQKNPDGTIATVAGIGNALTVKMPLLIENVQVIGVIDSSAASTGAGGANAAPAPSSAPVLTGGSKLLILAVTPAQAEVLLFARTSGTIDVVYRSANDTDQVATDGVILKTLIDKYGILPPTVILAQTP
jgi:Flp pilus assembly protein CpaB